MKNARKVKIFFISNTKAYKGSMGNFVSIILSDLEKFKQRSSRDGRPIKTLSTEAEKGQSQNIIKNFNYI